MQPAALGNLRLLVAPTWVKGIRVRGRASSCPVEVERMLLSTSPLVKIDIPPSSPRRKHTTAHPHQIVLQNQSVWVICMPHGSENRPNTLTVQGNSALNHVGKRGLPEFKIEAGTNCYQHCLMILINQLILTNVFYYSDHLWVYFFLQNNL